MSVTNQTPMISSFIADISKRKWKCSVWQPSSWFSNCSLRRPSQTCIDCHLFLQSIKALSTFWSHVSHLDLQRVHHRESPAPLYLTLHINNQMQTYGLPGKQSQYVCPSLLTQVLGSPIGEFSNVRIKTMNISRNYLC